jgi:hypothetical protein
MHSKVAHLWQLLHSLKVCKVMYIKMLVYFDIINLVGKYMVVNELKSPYVE